jgi:hypothetical protein
VTAPTKRKYISATEKRRVLFAGWVIVEVHAALARQSNNQLHAISRRRKTAIPHLADLENGDRNRRGVGIGFTSRWNQF